MVDKNDERMMRIMLPSLMLKQVMTERLNECIIERPTQSSDK
jgi:hypothetical protein